IGAGRYMSRSQVIGDLLNMANNPPWTNTVDTGSRGDNLTLAACGPTCRSLDTINPGLKGAVAGVSSNTTFRPTNIDFRQPESWQLNVTVSHEILKDTVVEASYVGNRGRHIWRREVPYNPVTLSARPVVALAQRNGGASGDLINASRVYTGLGPVLAS